CQETLRGTIGCSAGALHFTQRGGKTPPGRITTCLPSRQYSPASRFSSAALGGRYGLVLRRPPFRRLVAQEYTVQGENAVDTRARSSRRYEAIPLRTARP